MAQVGQSPGDVQLLVQHQLLQGRVLGLGHDQVVQVSQLEPEAAPLADGRHPGEGVPLLSLGPALELLEVHGDLGHFRVLGPLAPVQHRDGEHDDIGGNVTIKRIN